MKLTVSELKKVTPDPDRDLVVLDDELRGFGLRMKPSGRTSYFVQYRNRYGRSRRHTFAKGEEMPPEKARKRAKTLLGGVAAGQDPAEEKKERLGTITVRELAKEYLEKHLRPRRKPSTIHEYTRALERIILPRIGSRKVTDLSRRFLQDLHANLARTPTTANRIIKLLSAMIGYAERRDLVPPGTNLCSAVERFPDKSRERFLTSAELARLGEVLRTAGTNPRRRKRPKKGRSTWKDVHPSGILAIRLLAMTGMRRGEVLNLKWDYLDFERGLAHLPDSKTGRKRVPLARPVLDLLASSPRMEGNPYVIWGETQGQPLVGLQRIWEKVRAEAGLDDVRMHDLRHTYASFGAAAGFGLFVIGHVLGHADAATTQRYAHLGPDPVRMAAERISEEISVALTG
jgi:integrase